MSTRNVRRRLDQFLQNPSCEANTLSVAMDVAMREVAAHEGEPTHEAQSPYALRRGALFEKALFDKDAESLRGALAKANVIPSEHAVVVDLRLTRNQGPWVKNLDMARDAFAQWLGTARDRPEKTHIFLAPAIDAPARDVLGEGILAPDIVVAHPVDGRWELEIGEVKVYPDRGGHTDTSNLAATRSQAGLYLFALRTALATIPSVSVRRAGFLVLSWAGTNRPSIRPGEDLEFRARAAERGIAQLREAAAAVTVEPVEPKRRLAVISQANTDYREACISFCARATRCHRTACEQGSPSALGDAAAAALRGVDLARAAAIIDGRAPSNDREAAVAWRFAQLRALVS
ncbi:MAG: hypothetical protein U0269_33160 [Polyangiales bacterium]